MRNSRTSKAPVEHDNIIAHCDVQRYIGTRATRAASDPSRALGGGFEGGAYDLARRQAAKGSTAALALRAARSPGRSGKDKHRDEPARAGHRAQRRQG